MMYSKTFPFPLRLSSSFLPSFLPSLLFFFESLFLSSFLPFFLSPAIARQTPDRWHLSVRLQEDHDRRCASIIALVRRDRCGVRTYAGRM
ncbi:hypothetical protein BDN70DRAFT_624385 [Pholiota conissans]|uniref:Uncharacterized protein n=1 Tax=Pholiota conissans TaxID=109636 RepID=A0A9P5Z3Y4_9AGAR|nr:hypothetical protein BDN70DRAFT_624385 [Pholiota conissans]